MLNQFSKFWFETHSLFLYNIIICTQISLLTFTTRFNLLTIWWWGLMAGSLSLLHSYSGDVGLSGFDLVGIPVILNATKTYQNHYSAKHLTCLNVHCYLGKLLYPMKFLGLSFILSMIYFLPNTISSLNRGLILVSNDRN